MMAQIPDSGTAALHDEWDQLSEVGAAVRRSLDDALSVLVRAAIDDPTLSYAASCHRIDQTFAVWMAPYRNLGWAMDQAAVLQRALKNSLSHRPYRTGEMPSAGRTMTVTLSRLRLK